MVFAKLFLAIILFNACLLVQGGLQFEDAIEKGERILQTLKDPSRKQSQFRSLPSENFEDALKALGWELYDWDPKTEPNCEQKVTVRNKMTGDEPGTNAYYAGLYNPGLGEIVALNTLSPAASHKKGFKGKIPDLQAWSDVSFLIYKTLAERQNIPLSNLNLVVQNTITNPDAMGIIEDICIRIKVRKPDPCPPEYPGLTYDVESDEGKALVGTANGGGAAWLLGQHADDFPNKKIKSLRIWGTLLDAESKALSYGMGMDYT